MLNLISIIISGFVVGLAARFLYPGPVPMGIGLTILLGIGGSLAAGLAVSRGRGDGVNGVGLLASIVGALVLIFIGRHL